jgi:hypothetical protein
MERMCLSRSEGRCGSLDVDSLDADNVDPNQKTRKRERNTCYKHVTSRAKILDLHEMSE